MKVIPLGLQCSVPEGIKRANLREYSYPFDWLWTPSKTTYNILNLLINDSVEKALEYMTTGYTYYKYLGNEHYISVNNITESQMNKNTGLGNTYFKIDNEYKNKLKIRLERLIRDIKSNQNILFIYADAANFYLNYHLDDVEYGVDATEYLLKIYDLIYPVNNNIKITYFCWNERKGKNNTIEYISYNYKNGWDEVSELIKTYLINFNGHFKMGTLEIIDKITNDEVNHFHDKLNIFNKSKKIKFLFLRCRDASSWITDTTQLWGPDIESEYIVDILTDDGRFDNIEFLSIPYHFDVTLLTKIDILAYSSNIYSVDYIENVIHRIQPSVLLHLSDECGTRPEYFKLFENVNLVYRQYKFLHKKEYEKENIPKIRYLPIGYHSWGKNYHRQKNELINRKYKWCFIGSLDKSNRMSQLQKLYVVEPYFCNTMPAFESTSIYRNSIFTFCPQGSSDLECSRSYEAMYNGCIPIIMGTTEQNENLKNRFDIQLPVYFITTLDEMIDIMKNTSMTELIEMQHKCYDWIMQNSELIRVNIIASLNK